MADKNVLYRNVAATDGRLRTMETSIKKINSWIKKMVPLRSRLHYKNHTYKVLRNSCTYDKICAVTL